MVVNVMESILAELLERYCERLQSTCRCVKCKSDVMALSLNRVKPRYVTNKDAVAFVKAEFFEKQATTTLLVQLAECAMIVSNNPQCEKMNGRKNDQLSSMSS